MPVVEISRIQVRRGQENQTGVPVLESGEFGWASDTEHLYIGLRRVDGGARDANVRILTENDLRNFFSSGSSLSNNTSTAYTYRDGLAIATSSTNYLTSSTVLDEIVRLQREKLDDIVNVKDFGAIGDGYNDDTGPIQAAIISLFSTDRQSDLGLLPRGVANADSALFKTIYFPSGDYKITGKIWLHAFTKLVGEGKENTRIRQMNQQTFFATVDTNITDNPGAADFFPVNYEDFPNYVGIENMTLVHTTGSSVVSTSTPFIQLNCSSHSHIKNVRMVGTYTTSSNITQGYAGIELRSVNNQWNTKDITIENCEFEALNVGIRSNHDIDHLYINNNFFKELNRGVSFCDEIWYTDPIGSDLRRFTNYGPRYAKITNNYFDDILREAIHIGAGNFTGGLTTATSTGTYHVSMNNIFKKVGNLSSYNMDNSTGTSIIKFVPKNNVSRNDVFYRYDYELAYYDSNTSTFVQLIEGNTAIESDVVRANQVSAGTSATVILIPLNGNPQYVNIKYHMYNYATGVDQVDRRGNLDIYIPSGYSPTVSFMDNYNFNNNDASSYSNWITGINGNTRTYQVKLWNRNPPGSGATFNVTNPNTLGTGTYTVTLVSGGSNYEIGDTLTLSGIYFSTGTTVSTSPTNDVVVSVFALSGSSIASGGFTFVGTAATVTNTTTFFISTTSFSRLGGSGAGTSLFLDHQLSIMTV